MRKNREPIAGTDSDYYKGYKEGYKDGIAAVEQIKSTPCPSKGCVFSKDHVCKHSFEYVNGKDADAKEKENTR